MPELGPYGSVRGALSIRPPKHAAQRQPPPFHYKDLYLSSNETPGDPLAEGSRAGTRRVILEGELEIRAILVSLFLR